MHSENIIGDFCADDEMRLIPFDGMGLAVREMNCEDPRKHATSVLGRCAVVN